MKKAQLIDLAKKLDAAPTLTAALTEDVVAAVRQLWPDASVAMLDAKALYTTDHALHLVNQMLPEWTISLDGVADDKMGDWTCSLRQSRVTDSDPYLGVGHAAKPAHAILAALFAALASRVSG